MKLSIEGLQRGQQSLAVGTAPSRTGVPSRPRRITGSTAIGVISGASPRDDVAETFAAEGVDRRVDKPDIDAERGVDNSYQTRPLRRRGARAAAGVRIRAAGRPRGGLAAEDNSQIAADNVGVARNIGNASSGIVGRVQ